MKREIKFRAWHKEQKRMFRVYGLGPNFITEDTFDGVDYGTNAWNDDDLNFIEVMQYTGLKDKNGVEIYEGDIVKHHAHDTTSLISWLESGICFGGKEIKHRALTGERFYFLQLDGKNLEVIGNIHQNPELLGTAIGIGANTTGGSKADSPAIAQMKGNQDV